MIYLFHSVLRFLSHPCTTPVSNGFDLAKSSVDQKGTQNTLQVRVQERTTHRSHLVFEKKTANTLKTMNGGQLRQLIENYAPYEMETDTIDYLASVLIDQESDFERIIADFIEGQAAQDLTMEAEAILSKWEHRPLSSQLPVSIASPLLPTKDTSTDEQESHSFDGSQQPKSRSEERRRKRDAKKQEKLQKRREKHKIDADDFVDDDISAWNDRLADGKAWGGRSYGGRGVRGDVNTASNIHLSNVTLQFAGNELLQNSTIQINGGHRYGLVGRNGCGKSTLLRRLEAHAVPGIPYDLRILLVKQQAEGGDETALQLLISADRERASLLAEQLALEESMTSTNALEQVVVRLAEIATDLEMIGADQAEDKATLILKGLQFSKAMMNSPTRALSGGWRMR